MRSALVLFWVVELFSPGALPQNPPALTHVPSATTASISFNVYRDYLIVVHGSLGELQGLNFLLDTGANPTAVDPKVAKRLGLKTEHTANLTLLHQNARVKRVVLPRIQLGPVSVDALPGVVQDLDPVAAFLGVRIDAIIGFGVLSQTSFAIDYGSKKLLFGSIEPSAFSTPLYQGPATFTVQLRVQDRPVALLVDTGSRDLIFFACQLSPNMRNFVTRGFKTSLNSEGQGVELREVWVSKVGIGKVDFGTKPALISDDDVNCGQSFDGVVAPTSLGLKWIAFDFDHMRFSWR